MPEAETQGRARPITIAGVPHMVEMGWLPLRKGALKCGKEPGNEKATAEKTD